MNNINVYANNNNIIKKYINLFSENATLHLLTSSILVSISGMFRVYIAALLLQTHVSVLTCIASGLIIYSVYTLDRTLDSEEDKINRVELAGYNKKIGLAVIIITFLAGTYIFYEEGVLLFAFLPFVTGFLYSKGITLGKYSLRLKGSYGVKNLIVGLIWAIFITGIAGYQKYNLLASAAVFLFYGAKVFINSVIDDFKDIKGDTLAGIKTLPVTLGEYKTRELLLGFHIFSNLILAVALVSGLIEYYPIVVLCSLICGGFCIVHYTNYNNYVSGKLGLSISKDGESALTALLICIFNELIL